MIWLSFRKSQSYQTGDVSLPMRFRRSSTEGNCDCKFSGNWLVTRYSLIPIGLLASRREYSATRLFLLLQSNKPIDASSRDTSLLQVHLSIDRVPLYVKPKVQQPIIDDVNSLGAILSMPRNTKKGMRDRYVMRPWYLCRHCLHKFIIRICWCKLCHIFKIANRKPFGIRVFCSQISGKILYEFVSPCFMSIYDFSNMVVEKKKLFIGTGCCAILCTPNFSLNVCYDIEVFFLIHQHLISLSLWRSCFEFCLDLFKLPGRCVFSSANHQI